MALIKFVRDESGVTAVEYGLIAALIAVAIIVALTLLGQALSSNFSEIQNRVNSVI